MRLPFTFTTPLPAGTRVTPATLIADDEGESSGWLYEPPGPRPRTVVSLMHPRVEFGRHYLIPDLLALGVAVFAQNSRYLNHEV